jgi:hypothetical protein
MAISPDSKRVTATVDAKTFERIQFWADSKNISINQFLNDAIDLAINYENKNYPMTTLEQARLAQLVDGMASLSSNVKSLEKVVTSGFESLLGLTRGDNYLLEHDDGIL